MATAYGVRCLGPANPSHHERLKRYAKLARKRGREVEKADLEVRMLEIAAELAMTDPDYSDMALKFTEHFLCRLSRGARGRRHGDVG